VKIDLIAGARPNFIKISPILNAINSANRNGERISYRLIHTGQHYDKNMSKSFFEELEIINPDYNLNAGGGTQAEQTAKIMIEYEKLLKKPIVDYCLVVGDVTSTMACSIVAKKKNIKVIHVEGGIRSGDMSMPEEINRIVTDSITDYFFTTSKTANQNLIVAGINKKNIFFVGNTMIDTLVKFQHNFKKPSIWDGLKLKKQKYLILTLHRPSNVDNANKLKRILFEIDKSVDNNPIILPSHPRTLEKILELNIKFKNLKIIKPLSYLEFNYLVKNSMGVITDSGGITEETTVMNIPCLTIRDNTERPETVELGTNILIGTNPKNIKPALKQLLKGNWKKGSIPPLWDGKASSRIVEQLLRLN